MSRVMVGAVRAASRRRSWSTLVAAAVLAWGSASASPSAVRGKTPAPTQETGSAAPRPGGGGSPVVASGAERAPEFARVPELVMGPVAPHWITLPDGTRAWLEPPRAPERGGRVTLAFHGMCGRATNLCPHFRGLVSPSDWLVCPQAAARCEQGGYLWQQPRQLGSFDAIVQAVVDQSGGTAELGAGVILAGFSQGAFVALDLAQRGKLPVDSLVLVGAKVLPEVRRLRERGVAEVVMAAGQWDMMNTHMQRQTLALQGLGFPARFVGLGPVGHALPPDLPARLGPIWAGSAVGGSGPQGLSRP